MDYDFWGLKPTGDQGGRFQATGWEWDLLVGYCQQVAPELASEEWRKKGLDAAGTLSLAEALQTEINANRAEIYAREGASQHGVMFSTENIAAFAAFLRASGGFVVGVTDFDDETKAWLAIRKEAAKAIDPATAKVSWTYGDVGDPYGIKDLPDENHCVGRNYFARMPGTDVSVAFEDLPASARAQLWKRMDRNDPSLLDSDLPDADRLVKEIMWRDVLEPEYAAAVARGIMKARTKSANAVADTLATLKAGSGEPASQ